MVQQRLDYVGIPFRCSRCKATDHPRYQCSRELLHKASFGEGVVKLVSNEESTELEAWSDSLHSLTVDNDSYLSKLQPRGSNVFSKQSFTTISWMSGLAL